MPTDSEQTRIFSKKLYKTFGGVGVEVLPLRPLLEGVFEEVVFGVLVGLNFF
jgi:hypothetical protein